ncbi:Fanconi anemia group E protein isoform X1 [Rhineura floridana]|uniref:Fanconi anemia group E protein isoform X1 n=1 Tax=Rhineura floridana TaxID=261503 RepID=UPI002AC87E97|nr:Fanconi anemia group E protein isoform X1 [Rhineura floridana]XP_061488287.1 Fanconi anemia group E protein isoform X1 [Rhineura floridana]XP_061488288.1 Fanconi anemia group E protein isoform X1 [Rhineura floridana]XP_061488289.1 Fanconi anemia group E protein isoform X1 [Rhineura floridana]
MDSPSVPWLQRFDKSSHLLLCALMSGHWGALAAFRTLQRSLPGEEPRQGFSWQSFTENLCSQEPVLKGPEKTLTLKPLLLLLPVLCQRNLFSLLLTVQSTVPKECLRHLLYASRQDPSPDLWVQRLRDLLEVGVQENSSLMPVPLSDSCQQQLKDLCQKVMAPSCSKPGLERKLHWYVKQVDPCIVQSGDGPDSVSQIRKNKKVAGEPLSPDEEVPGKTSRLEVELNTELAGPRALQQGDDGANTRDELMIEVSGNEDVHNLSNDVYQSPPKEKAEETKTVNQSPQQVTAAEVPDYIKDHVPKLKELLEMQFDHSDGTAPPELQVFNKCTPSQLESLCSLLELSECPENVLLHFCTWLVALSPDLGYSNAAVLAKKLFLPRVLLLTEPPSWPLTTALMMFCSKYARPICCTLISSIIQAPGKGLEQMKLVCKLIEECLDPAYVKLVFSHIIEMPWSEDLLTAVHALLGRQVELSTEFFNMLILNLCQMAQEFAASMHYAKVVLTVLTNYQGSITLAHQHRLSCALDLNKTILKKSLQAALKRVTSDKK